MKYYWNSGLVVVSCWMMALLVCKCSSELVYSYSSLPMAVLVMVVVMVGVEVEMMMGELVTVMIHRKSECGKVVVTPVTLKQVTRKVTYYHHLAYSQ